MNLRSASMISRTLLVLLALLLMPALAAAQDIEELPSPYPYPPPAWSPYVVGALIGVLTMLTLTISKKPVGASSAYANLAGLAGRVVAPDHIASLPYFKEKKPTIDWEMIFVIGAVIGAFIAAWTGGELTGYYLQDMWVIRFGADSHVLRTILALVGGAIMAYGARMAGGCTSGHGISGTLQLAVGSWVAVICFFIGGIAVAIPLYRLL
jgi:uncharacterized protein